MYQYVNDKHIYSCQRKADLHTGFRLNTLPVILSLEEKIQYKTVHSATTHIG